MAQYLICQSSHILLPLCLSHNSKLQNILPRILLFSLPHLYFLPANQNPHQISLSVLVSFLLLWQKYLPGMVLAGTSIPELSSAWKKYFKKILSMHIYSLMLWKYWENHECTRGKMACSKALSFHGTSIHFIFALGLGQNRFGHWWSCFPVDWRKR